jgi:quercetin dioxygenase-like cupin family protein
MSEIRARVVDPEAVEPLPPVSSRYLLAGGTVVPLSPALWTDEVKVNAIWFEPGARFLPHRHPYDQVLYYPVGTGVVAVDGNEDQLVPTGHYVLLPANVVHMHGCTDDGPALQISIMRDTPSDFEVEVPGSWERWRP